MTLSDRKKIEQEIYDLQYGAGEENCNTSMRSLLLSESDDFFTKSVLRDAKGKDVLEIGCGDGSFGAQIIPLSKAYSGIDLSEAGVRRAREKLGGERAMFHVMDAENLDFPDASFDLVVNREVFSSIDFERVLPEIMRVLRPGGRLIGMESFGHNPVFNLNRQLKKLLGLRSEWAVSHIFRCENLQSLEEVCEAVEVRYYHCFVALGYPLVRLPDNLLSTTVISVLKQLDRMLLKLPSLQRLAFKVVFICKKKSSSERS